MCSLYSISPSHCLTLQCNPVCNSKECLPHFPRILRYAWIHSGCYLKFKFAPPQADLAPQSTDLSAGLYLRQIPRPIDQPAARRERRTNSIQWIHKSNTSWAGCLVRRSFSKQWGHVCPPLSGATVPRNLVSILAFSGVCTLAYPSHLLHSCGTYVPLYLKEERTKVYSCPLAQLNLSLSSGVAVLACFQSK